ncbi:MAG: GNAT family N-acetyltransferase, partial [Actinobacteria bacterium]|nr:GNAT family N-acetyltransferase [Actinomycetota bacterium]
MQKPDLKKIKVRPVTTQDISVILDFIRRLALYEKRLHEVTATEKDISDVLFERKIAEAVIAEYERMPVGFAIFFYNFSTFTGKAGIY